MKDDTVPGFTASPELEAKLNGLDDQLNPIETDIKEEPKVPEDDKPEEVTEDNQDDSTTDDTTDGDEEEKEEDEGYTIDGDEEEEADEAPSNSTEESKTNPNLTPEQQYILDNLQAITVRGTVGDDTKVQDFTVYSPEQLPQGFKYTDERESSIANKNFALLENQALTLQNDYRTQQTQKSAREFKEREDAADTADIGELQRAGDLPKFKAQPNDPKFNDDPGVKLVQDILDYKEAQNAKYMEEYNAGRPYKHIGFQEAFTMYRRENPDKSNDSQKAEDAERKELAQRTSGTRGASTKSSAPKVHSGMMSRDLDALIESRTQGW
jgi:hypothetical protein